MTNYRRTMVILLGVVVFSGSIPISFSEPLRVQLEQGIETDQIQCDNDSHMLVQRINRKVACVTEETALKLGWEIISQTTKVNSTTEISSRIIPTTNFSNGVTVKPLRADTQIGYSTIPVLGEIFTINLSTTFSEFWYAEDGSFEDTIGIELSGFEIVNIDPVFTNYSTEKHNGYDVAESSSSVNLIQPQEFQYTITAKPTKLDYASISFDGLLDDKVESTLWIGTDKSYYYSDVKYDFLDVVEIVDDNWIYTVNAKVEFNEEYSIIEDEMENGYKGRTIEELNQVGIPLIYNTTSYQVDLTNLTPMQEDILFERYNNLDTSLEQVRQSITHNTILPTETIDSLVNQIPSRLMSSSEISMFDVDPETIEPPEPITKGEAPERTLEQVKIDTYGDLTIDEIIELSPWSNEDYVAMIEVREFSEQQAREFLMNVQVSNIEEIITEAFAQLSTQSFFLPSSYAQVPSSYRIFGVINNSPSPYDSDNRDVRVNNARVCLYDYDTIDRKFTKLSCKYASDTGFYDFRSLSVPTTSKDNTLDISVQVISYSQSALIKNFSGQFYADNTPSKKILRSIDRVNFSTDSSGTLNDTKMHRALWIIDTLGEAKKFFSHENLGSVQTVKVIWQHDGDLENFSNTSDDAQYVSNVNTIYLDGSSGTNQHQRGDSYEMWTILHEYGHHVMNNNIANGLNVGGCTSPHYIDGNERDDRGILTGKFIGNEGCAWTEGFADFVPHLVTDEPKLQWTRTSWIDMEKHATYGSSINTRNTDFDGLDGSKLVGEKTEGRFAAMLWDIKDNNDDSYDSGKDNREDGNNEIITAFKTFRVSTINPVESFYTLWNNQYSSKSLVSVGELHKMSFAHLSPSADSQTVSVTATDGTVITLTGSDPENQLLKFHKVTNPSKGTLSLNDAVLPRGDQRATSVQVTYTPNNGATGTDSFTFKVHDGTYFSSTVRVTINIQLVAEEAPVIENVRNKRVMEGASTTTNVRVTDVNDDRITLSLSADPDYNTPLPSWITLSGHGNGIGVIAIHTPSEVPETTYYLRVTATDNDGSDHDDFRIYITEVNQSPILSSIGTKSIQERQNLSFRLSSTDPDIPFQTLRYFITNTPPQQPSDVPDNISLNTSTGEFNWTPTDVQKGFHSYVFTVTDSVGATDTETVSITVSAIPNSPPKKTPMPTSGSVTSSSVTVSWVAPSSGSSLITEYDIFRSASPKILVGTVPATQLSYTDDTVLPSTTYQYTISAKNQYGSGDESDPLNITTLADTTAPAITLTGDNPQIIELGTGYTELGATTDDGSTVTIDSSAFVDTIGSYDILYDSTDSAGNNAIQVTRTVTVEDNTAPIITLTGDNPQIIELGNGYTELGATTDDNSDITIDSSAFVDTIGSYDILYDSTDSAGNAAIQVTRIVTVEDNTAPIITLTGDNPQIIDLGTGYTELGATTDDGSSVTIDSSAFTDALGSYSITYDSTDASGNDAIQNLRTVTVLPKIDTPPVIDAIGDVIINEGEDKIITVNATDADGDAITYSLIQNTTSSSSSFASIINHTITLSPTYDDAGIHSVTVNATSNDLSDDTSFGVTVSNVDRSPTIAPINDVTINEGQTQIIPVNATDADGDAITYFLTQNTPSFATISNHTITLSPTFTDSGNHTIAVNVTAGSKSDDTSFAVTVNDVDITPPVIALIGANPQVIELGDEYTEFGAVTDDGSPVIINATAFEDALGSYSITYDSTDTSGNKAIQVIRTVNILDTTAPAIITPDDVTAEATTVLTTIPIQNATATDASSSSLFSSPIIITNNATEYIADGFPLGTTAINWVATDTSGNTANATQTVTITDTTVPSIVSPTDKSFEATAINTPLTELDYGTATATDIFNPITITNNATATFPLGTTTIAYTATDANGLNSTTTQDITITDTTIPSITPPIAYTAEATDVLSILTQDDYGTATAADIFGSTITSDAPTTFPLGNTTINWTATDTNGLNATATQTVTLTDTTTPTITTPTDQLFEATAILSTLTQDDYGTATATDIFNPITITNNATVTFPLNNTTILWIATDANGLNATATQIITITDTTIPTINTPAAFTAEATAVNTPLTELDYDTATASDIFGSTITSDAPITFPLGNTTINWTATDTNGLNTTATQIITITDTTSPTINTPTDQLFEATAILSTLTQDDYGTATATDIFNPVTITSNATEYIADGFPLGITGINWVATDTSGNTANATQIITITDTTVPSIVSPTDKSFEATAINTPLTELDYGTATATDIFNPVTITSNATATFPLGTTTIAYTATDGNGLTNSTTQTITVTDTTAPIITILGDNPQTVEAYISAYSDAGATAHDNIDGNVTQSVIITANPVNSTIIDTYTVEYFVSDLSGNNASASRIVTVQDTTAPAIITPDDVTAEATAVLTAIQIQNATATDASLSSSSSSPITITNNATGHIADGFPLGITGINWVATDASNNTSNATQIITIQDTTPPVISLLGNATVSVQYNSAYSDAGAIAADIYDGNLTDSIITINSVNTSSVGNYTITYDVTDSSNNDALQNLRIVTVLPKIDVPPVIDAIGDITIDEGQTLTVTVNATDADDGDTITYSLIHNTLSFVNMTNNTISISPTFTDAGDYSVTVNATSNGLSDDTSFNVTVSNVDRSPTITPINNVIIDEGDTEILTVNATDPDGDTITYLLTQNTPSFAILTNDTITLSPAFTDSGNYTATVNATANGKYASTSFAITVNDDDDVTRVTMPIDPTKWAGTKTVTVSHEMVSGDDSLEDFPLLVSFTDESLQSARTDGADLTFTNIANYTIPFEIESWDNTTGTIVSWVNIPVLSASEDTVILLHYDNPLQLTSLATPEAVWSNNDYLAVYHMSDATAATATTDDSTIHNNDGANSGATSIQGKISNSQDFDGANDRVILPNDKGLNLSGDTMTISAWVNADVTDGTHTILGKSYDSSHSSPYYEWLLFQAQDRYHTRASFTAFDTAAGTVTANTWQYVTTTYDGIDLTLYVNGILESSTPKTNLLQQSDQSPTIGGRNTPDDTNPNAESFDGQIDEVRISNVTKSAHWIATEYTNQNDPNSFHTITPAPILPDVIAPVITLTGENPQTISLGAGYTELGAVTDDGSAVTIDSSAFADIVGSYSILYDSVDTSGNHAIQITRTIHVTDLSSYAGTKTITINHDKISGDDSLIDYPLLVSFTDIPLQSARADGADITFTDTENNVLPFEIESWNSTTGSIVSWVNVPVLSATANTNTTVLLHYDNPLQLTSLAAPESVWSKSSYEAVYHMNQNVFGVTNDTADSTSSQLHGTTMGAMNVVSNSIPSKIGQGLDFDGNDDFIDLPDFTSDTFKNNHTISAWVNYDTLNHWSRIIDFSAGGSANDNILIANQGTTQNLAYEVYVGSTGGNKLVSADAIDRDTWMHVTVTHDGNTNQAIMYKDGIPIQSGTVHDVSDVTRTTNYIAKSNWDNDGYFDGTMDELRISSDTKTAHYIKTQHANQNDPGSFYVITPAPVIPDVISPVITLNGNNPQTIQLGDGYTDLGATTDDGSTVNIDATAFTDAIGSYPIYYDSVDSSGNAAIKVTRTVHVVDLSSSANTKVITINPDHVSGTENMTNYPLLVSFADVSLQSARADGADMIFTDTNNNVLPFEIESWDNTTGTIVSWVNIPTLSASEDTVILLHYNNPSQTVSLAEPSDVWYNDAFVAHFAEIATDGGGGGDDNNNNNTSISDSTIHNAAATDHGTTSVDVSAGGGKIGDARSFDGTSWIDYDDSVLPSSDNPRTISLWANPDTLNPGWHGIVAYGTPAGNGTPAGSVFGLFHNGNNLWGGGYGDDVNTNHQLNTDQWSKLDMTYDGSTVITYVNGEQTATDDTKNWETILEQFRIGRQVNTAPEYFTGLIDEARISHIAKSADYLKTEYTNQNDPGSFYSITPTPIIPDVISPVITLTGENPQTIQLGNPYTDLGAVTDDGSAVTIDSSAFADIVGSYSILYDSVDSSGNHAIQITRTVHVVDLSSSANTKVITINPDHVSGTENMINYPLLVSFADIPLQSARADGADITFTDTENNVLPFEIESWDNTTGSIVSWVNIPILSASNNTVIYLHYNNPSQTVSLADPESVWGNNDYLAVYHMSDVDDSTIHNNDGILSGTTGNVAAGKISNSQNFDGANDRVILPNDKGLNLSGDTMTISAWVNADVTDGTHTILGKSYDSSHSSPYYEWLLFQAQDRYHTRASFTAFDTVAGIITANNWQYITATYDGIDLTLYVNGILESSVPKTGPILQSDQSPTIGGRNTPDNTNPNAESFDGQIDEVRISNVAKSAHWIQTEWNNQNDPGSFYNITSVSDTIPPVITLIGSNPQTVHLGAGYTELGATTDDGSPVTIDDSAFVDAIGSYFILYDSADAAGNQAIQVIRTVHVINTTTPAQNLYVSAENPMFGNYMSGPQIIEVVVIDSDISDVDEPQGEPDVTVNGKDLRMMQALDGNWYGYFADRNMAQIADSTVVAENGVGLDYGDFCNANDGIAVLGIDLLDTDGFAVSNTGEITGMIGSSSGGDITNNCTFISGTSGNTMNVLRETKDINVNSESGIGQIGLNDIDNWPFIQLYELNPTGNVHIEYKKGGGDPQQTVLTFDEVDHFADLSLDRNKYPTNAQVHATITDLWLNIDPTDEDSWTFQANQNSSATMYQVFDENGYASGDAVAGGAIDIQPIIYDLMCESNCVLAFDPDTQNVGTDIVTIQDNNNAIVTISGDSESASSAQTSQIPSGTYPITITETSPNTGIFTTFDESNISALRITDDATRGTSATIDYNEDRYTILVGFDHAYIDIQSVDDTWNSGEEALVVLVDGDVNLNSLHDEDLDVYNPDVPLIPTLSTGNPFTLETISSAALADRDLTIIEVQKFSQRAMLDSGLDSIVIQDGDSLVLTTGDTFSDLYDSINDPVDDFHGINIFHYDIRSLQKSLSVHGGSIISFDIDITDGIKTLRLASNVDSFHDNLIDLSSVNGDDGIFSMDENAPVQIVFTFDVVVSTGRTIGPGDIFLPVAMFPKIPENTVLPIVTDFFSFGFIGDGMESSQRIANQIIRIELEETGDNTNTFEGSLRYTMINQLNINDVDTYLGIEPIEDDPTFIVIEDLTDEDSPRVNYLDLGADGVTTQVADQEEAPTHSGIVSFDNDSYKIGDMVIVTLDDADLNVDSELIDVFTVVSTSGDDVYDAVGMSGLATDLSFGDLGFLLDVTFNDERWLNSAELGGDDGTVTCGTAVKDTVHDGLAETGFTLVETGRDSGIFSGEFEVPSEYCKRTGFAGNGDGMPTTVTGVDIEVNYVDFRDASGEIIIIGDSAGIRANTGSVSLDRTVYPVPFGTPGNFVPNVSESPAGRSVFPIHTTGTGVDSDSVLDAGEFLTGGDLTVHIRVNDPDYDVQPSGEDVISTNSTVGVGPVKVSVLRGSDVVTLGYAGGSAMLDGPIDVGADSPTTTRQFGPMHETAPDSGIFEADIVIRYTDGPASILCPNTGIFTNIVGTLSTAENGRFDDDSFDAGSYCILQGDVLQVEYTDAADASGDLNVVTDSAVFDLRNGVLQSDNSVYTIGSDMILTVIDPDLDLDNNVAETYDIDIIEWNSDAAVTTIGDSSILGVSIADFDPEPSEFRETGDSTGIFQVVIKIPESLNGTSLDSGERIILEYVDWGSSDAGYVGNGTSNNSTLTVFAQ